MAALDGLRTNRSRPRHSPRWTNSGGTWPPAAEHDPQGRCRAGGGTFGLVEGPRRRPGLAHRTPRWPPPGSTCSGASRSRRCWTATPSAPGWSGSRTPSRCPTLLSEVKESTGRISARRCGEVVLADGPGVTAEHRCPGGTRQHPDHAGPKLGGGSPSTATTAPTSRGSRRWPAS